MRRVFVVGAGEVGGRLATALERSGSGIARVTRADGWSLLRDSTDETILVCVREDDLPAALERIGRGRSGRLVAVQNGFIEPALSGYPGHTRGLIWFRSKGELFEQLAPSLFHGPRAEPLVEGLVAGGLDARVVPEAGEFSREVVIKGAWNAVVGLPLAVHGTTLGDYLDDHAEECRAVVEETVRAASVGLRVSIGSAEALERLLATTRTLREVRGGTTALAWRAGAVARMGRRYGIPTPVTDRLLVAAGQDPGSLGSSFPGSP